MTADGADRRRAKDLDDALGGRTPADDEVARLADIGGEIQRALAGDVPPADRQRALFVSGASSRRPRFGIGRTLVPAFGVAALIALAFLGGRNALPGEPLYPVREVLGRVGLASTIADEANRHIERAAGLIERARSRTERHPILAGELAARALKELGAAEELVEDLRGSARTERETRIEVLTDHAVEALRASVLIPEISGADGSSGPGSGDGDSSGPGSGDDDGDDDSSGPGSGDDRDDDSSGPGSGDDDGGDDDSSGPGSGSAERDDDDSSGPGSGDDDDRDDDSSGPGSGDDRDGDSSGPGSGDDGSGSSGSGSDDDPDDD